MFYLFQLGREPMLSAAEIRAVFLVTAAPPIKTTIKNGWLVAETERPIDALELMNRLGGTVKICEEIKQNSTKLNKIIDTINEYLCWKHPEGKIVFSLSGEDARRQAIEIKKELKKMGRSVRFIEPKNTATILHNKLVEKESDLTIIDDKIFVTRAIQPFEEMSQRDYGRPGRDARSGMLPPKLARILINLSGANPRESTLLDPFCGSGTILMEAMLMGFKKLIGSDLSLQAINDAGQNIEWLNKNFSTFSPAVKKLPITNYHLPFTNYQLHCSGVETLSKYIKNYSVVVIVTVPSLGRPLKGSETENQLRKQAEELKQLYLNAFRAFYQILKPDGVVIFIIPRFRRQNNWLKIDCAAAIEKEGFDVIPLSEKEQFLLYARPDQRVGREVWKFKLHEPRDTYHESQYKFE